MLISKAKYVVAHAAHYSFLIDLIKNSYGADDDKFDLWPWMTFIKSNSDEDYDMLARMSVQREAANNQIYYIIKRAICLQANSALNLFFFVLSCFF